MPSKVFGPTDSVADTVTQIGSNYVMPPGNWVITKLFVGKGNVVNAAGAAGFIIVETVNRTYHFAYGNGSGGATDGINIPAEPIDCFINAPGGQTVKIFALDATAAKDVTVEADFEQGNGGDVFTLAGGGVSANGDTAADTAEDFTVSTKGTPYKMTLTPHRAATIKQIRFAGSGVVDAKANTCKVTINVSGEAGPYEFSFGAGPGGALTSSMTWADVRNCTIPIPSGIALSITIVSAEIMKFPHISLLCA